MKYLLIILFCIYTNHSYGVEKLTVTPDNGATMESMFSTKEEALDNLRKRIHKKQWMKCEWKEQPHEINLTIVTQKREESFLGLDSNIVDVIHHCHPKNFTYTIENCDDELAERERSRSEIAKDSDEFKKLLNQINNDPDLKPYMKKFMKYVIKRID